MENIFIFNAAFAVAILVLISRVHLALFLILLDKYLKYPYSAIVIIHLLLGYLLLDSFLLIFSPYSFQFLNMF